MRIFHLICINFFAITTNCLEFCPSGSLIIVKGLKTSDEEATTYAHNNARQRLVDGVVHNQPRAKYMKTLVYDGSLAHKAAPVTRQCADNPMEVKDRRWPSIGQNTYMTCNDRFDPLPNWEKVVNHWFEEHRFYVLANGNLNGDEVSHYRQLAWANTDTFGCDFLAFINSDTPETPFCQVYVCNYGISANNVVNINLPPYETV